MNYTLLFQETNRAIGELIDEYQLSTPQFEILPKDYYDFIIETNGGYFNDDKNCFSISDFYRNQLIMRIRG